MPRGLLNEKQAARIRGLIVGRMPDQLKLPFYLWTRAAVVALIRRIYGLEVSLVTVGRYLKAWGMSPQKPVRRAYERQDAAITRWLRQEYPALARRAKRERAALYWGDEMGLRSDHVTGPQLCSSGADAHHQGDRPALRVQHDLGDYEQRRPRVHGLSGTVSCTGLCSVPDPIAEVG